MNAKGNTTRPDDRRSAWVPALLAQWQQYRRERREVFALDARMRRDVGLTAEEVFRSYSSFRAWRRLNRSPARGRSERPAAVRSAGVCLD